MIPKGNKTDEPQFTLSRYKEILDLAAKHFSFTGIKGIRNQGPLCFWRHDVDHSLHRARRMAEIEAQKSIRATYYINPHCRFYNLLEPEPAEIVFEILAMGHDIGLHFDPGFFSGIPLSQLSTITQLEMDKEIIERYFRVEVMSFSIHDPTAFSTSELYEEKIAGMINTYGIVFQQEFCYCSDSNGYWRHEKLDSFLKKNKGKKIHVLTHPGWWQDEPMPPRDRVILSVQGRMDSLLKYYDGKLEKAGRKNIS